MAPRPTPPVLVFGWGNPSRGDDALGPLCVQGLRNALASSVDLECLDDYQLQVEHVLDLAGRQRVLFVDASLDCRAPFEVTALRPARNASVSSHALSPQALLQVYRDLNGEEAPASTLLAIRGEHFRLGEPPGTDALANLQAALQWAATWIAADRPA